MSSPEERPAAVAADAPIVEAVAIVRLGLADRAGVLVGLDGAVLAFGLLWGQGRSRWRRLAWRDRQSLGSLHCVLA